MPGWPDRRLALDRHRRPGPAESRAAVRRTKGMAMRLGRSWDVPDEFWLLWWHSRELRTLIMRAEVEPAGKGPAGRGSAPEFQRQVMDQMERCGRYPMTGPVALDLHFRAARRNPPGIHRAVAHRSAVALSDR